MEKKNNNRAKKMWFFFTLSFGVFSSCYIAKEFIGSKIQKNNTMQLGAATCFKRVGQTFTALMIKDSGSNYLSKDFTNTSGECYEELTKVFDEQYALNFIEGKRLLNKLTSDLHWFHEKVGKLYKKVQNNEVVVSTSSSILTKFSMLEELNNEFKGLINKKSSEFAAIQNTLFLIGTISLASLMCVVLWFSYGLYKRNKYIQDINLRSKDLLLEDDLNGAQVDRLVENFSRNLNAHFFYELVSKYHIDLLEKHTEHFGKDIDGEALKMGQGDKEGELSNTWKGHEEEGEHSNELDAQESAEFKNVIGHLIEKLNEKSFTHGIIFDTDLSEDFIVKGPQESLEQLVYTVINYGIEKSLNHNQGRKISIRSRPLGGIAYFQMTIANHLFNPDEIEVLNSQGKSQLSLDNTQDLNFVLLQELSKDLNLGISCKNIVNKDKFTGAQLKIVFNRIMEVKTDERPKKKSLSLFKGSKKELLKFMEDDNKGNNLEA